MLRSINPKRPRVHGSDHVNAGEDPVPGALILIKSDEVDTAETVSSTSRVTKFSLYLPANSYDFIYAEFCMVHRYEVDVNAKMNIIYLIQLSGTTKKTFNAKILACANTGIDTGQKETFYGSTIIPGGQTGPNNVDFTEQMDVNNANCGVIGKFARLWGINKNLRP